MISGFFGEYRHNLDEKNRLILPSRFRDDLGDRFIMACGLDSCLEILTAETWEAKMRELKQLPLTRRDNREFVRLIAQGVCEVEPDRTGRFIIPQNLREYAGIQKEVVITGVLDKIEIWSRENWEKYYLTARENYEKNAENIGEFR